jgi:hypothetical protein
MEKEKKSAGLLATLLSGVAVASLLEPVTNKAQGFVASSLQQARSQATGFTKKMIEMVVVAVLGLVGIIFIVMGLAVYLESRFTTQDLSKFGYMELKEAAKLLSAYKQLNDKTNFLGNEIRVEFNPESGNVFLVDEDCNVAMMNGNELQDWFVCPNCSHEGFAEDMKHGEDDKDCQEYLEQILKVEVQA